MLELSLQALLVLLGSVVSFSLYLNFIKLYKENKFSLFFWTHLLGYAFFTLFVVVYEFWMEQSHMQSIQEFVTTVTFTNVPFYFLEAAITIVGVLMMKKLMSLSKYSVVITFSQINVLFSAIGFYILGDKISFDSFIGLTIICIGAMIAGMKKHSLNIFKDYDKELFKYGILYALLQTSRIVITYMCTAKMNPTTHTILQTLTKHLHVIPFAHLSPLHFNIGVQCMTVVSLFVYTAYYLDKPESIINGMKNQPKVIFLLSALSTTFFFLYLKAFGMVENKDIVVGVQKLYVPLTILIGYYMHNDKPSKQTVLGVALIICGSMYTIFV